MSYNSWHGKQLRYHLGPILHFIAKETGSEEKVFCQGHVTRSEMEPETGPQLPPLTEPAAHHIDRKEKRLKNGLESSLV